MPTSGTLTSVFLRGFGANLVLSKYGFLQIVLLLERLGGTLLDPTVKRLDLSAS